MTLRVINPLPTMLHHYQNALCATLNKAGVVDLEVRSPNIEAGDASLLARAREHVTALTQARSDGPVLLLWPSFGYLEILLDALLNPRLSVIFHDARPLNRQFGMQPWQARMLGRLPRVTRSRRVLVHTQLAQSVLAELGWRPPTVLPYPLQPALEEPTVCTSHDDHRTCLVLGQYKPTRDLELLERLPPLLPGWSFRAVGRGWPPLSGWSVEPTFVTEDQLNDELRSADVVLVPYRKFFQSDVMVRAFELGRPAVTVHHEQTASLYGDSWTGFPGRWDEMSVRDGLVRAADVPIKELLQRAALAQEEAVSGWRGWLQTLEEGTLRD